MAHIFVSYARDDTTFVDRLVAALEGRGFDVWLDRSDIPGGAAWDASISAALQDAAQVVVVLSAAAVSSEHVARELALAGDYQRRIVPLQCEPMPAIIDRSPTQHQIRFRLAGLQRIDFSGADFERPFQRLLEALAGGTSGPASPPSDAVASPAIPRRQVRRALFGAAAIASALLLAIVVGYLLTSRSRTLPAADPQANPAISGEWFARVVYSWGDVLDERFEFAAHGTTLTGTAGYHLHPEPIQDGRIDGDRLTFQLGRTVRVDDREQPVSYRYQAKLIGGVLRFTMVDDLHRHPIAFTATRSPETAAAAAGRRPTAGTEPTLLPFSSSHYPVETVRRHIDAQMDAIRGCYRATEFDPVDHQSACYALRFDPAGQVTEIDTQEGRRSAALDACMERVLRGIAWGATDAGRRFPTRLCFAAPIQAPR